MYFKCKDGSWISERAIAGLGLSPEGELIAVIPRMEKVESVKLATRRLEDGTVKPVRADDIMGAFDDLLNWQQPARMGILKRESACAAEAQSAPAS